MPMRNHTGEKLQHGWVCDSKFHHKGNTQTDLKSDKNERKLTCARCGKVIVGITNYYMHFKDAHNKKFYIHYSLSIVFNYSNNTYIILLFLV